MVSNLFTFALFVAVCYARARFKHRFVSDTYLEIILISLFVSIAWDKAELFLYQLQSQIGINEILYIIHINTCIGV